jgi:hypothetical protein
MLKQRVGLLGAAAIVATLGGCSISTGPSSGSGGSSSSGGAPGTGGSTASGGAGGAGGEPSVTTLPGGKPLGTLAPTEATQLCNDVYAYFGQAISQTTLCKWTGLSFAVSSSAPNDTRLRENCTRQESSCLQAGPATPSCSPLPSTGHRCAIRRLHRRPDRRLQQGCQRIPWLHDRHPRRSARPVGVRDRRAASEVLDAHQPVPKHRRPYAARGNKPGRLRRRGRRLGNGRLGNRRLGWRGRKWWHSANGRRGWLHGRHHGRHRWNRENRWR